MGILGAVGVATTTVVKIAAVAGMAIGGIALGMDAFSLIIPEGAFGLDLARPTVNEFVKHATPFVAGLAGWHFAEWAGGRMHTMDEQSRQQAELRRLQSAHGVAL